MIKEVANPLNEKGAWIETRVPIFPFHSILFPHFHV